MTTGKPDFSALVSRMARKWSAQCAQLVEDTAAQHCATTGRWPEYVWLDTSNDPETLAAVATVYVGDVHPGPPEAGYTRLREVWRFGALNTTEVQ